MNQIQQEQQLIRVLWKNKAKIVRELGRIDLLIRSREERMARLSLTVLQRRMEELQ